MIKKSLLACLALLSLQVFALDDAGWLEKARGCLEKKRYLDSDETEEDGIYCISIAEILMEGKTDEQAIGEAELEAKQNLTEYIHGSSVSASRLVEAGTTETQDDDTVKANSFSKFHQKIETKVDAFIRGTKIVGQVTHKDTSYIVCVTCERFQDDSTILKAAQAEFGEEGVVKAIGEATNFEMAKQKAIRSAIEQVLGSVVVGYDKMSSSSDFSSKIFSGTDGVVEEYRILCEKEIAIGSRVELVAKVSKKSLLDNYSNYMKLLGDPEFFIECSSPDLESHFAQFFNDLGIRITKKPEAATYIIRCHGEFRDVTHPANGRSGKQLSLRFRVHEMNDKEEVLLDMKNDPRKSACFVGRDPDRQSEICAEKAFTQMKKPLHENIQKMVAKLVGRKMDAIQEAD